MAGPIVTLTTDFGTKSPYVAAMKGALLSVNPEVQLVDLSHNLPPQGLQACSIFLRSSLPYFPTGTLHVVVIDPGVGTDRALLYVEAGPQRLLVPDNGCWTELARVLAAPLHVVKLTERRFWRSEVSCTFHGRDILAPVAGHLSLGVPPEQLGPNATSWVEFELPQPRLTADFLEGEVLFVDDFGNLLTNLPGREYLSNIERINEVLVGDNAVTRKVRTYDEAAAGELVVLVSSAGTVEVAVVQGNAAERLGAAVGTPVRIQLRLPQ
jgi:S-adenosyl-L-methionine hydrolase (adenosine-forming)